MNFDGIPDLVVGNGAGSTTSVLLGNGDGTFQAKQDQAVVAGPAGVLFADVNGDGRQDVVTTAYFGSQITVLLGGNTSPATGTFGTATPFNTGVKPSSVAKGDFNGDGKLDLAVANYTDDNVTSWWRRQWLFLHQSDDLRGHWS